MHLLSDFMMIMSQLHIYLCFNEDTIAVQSGLGLALLLFTLSIDFFLYDTTLINAFWIWCLG